MRIKANRDQDHLWFVIFHKGSEDFISDSFVSNIPRACRKWCIHDSFLCMGCVFNPACPGINSPLMCGQKRHALFIEKYGLGSIAVVRVVVNDCDAFQSVNQGISCSDSHVIENTKSHGAIWFCMMSRWPDDGESVFCIAV